MRNNDYALKVPAQSFVICDSYFVSDLLQQWSGVCSDERSDLTSMIVIGFLA